MSKGMTDNNTVEIMGVKVFSKSFKAALQQVFTFLEEDRHHMVFTPNTEFIMRAQEDENFKEMLNASDMNIPDGVGLILASKVNKLGIEEKIAGVEFMGQVLKLCHQEGRTVYLLGGAPESLQMAVKNIKSKFQGLEIAGSRDGYFSPEDEAGIVEEINRVKPDVLFVALGSPKQEEWIYRNYGALKVRMSVGVGGSVDIWSGQAKRAPELMIKLGLEWLYRLAKQPTRIGRMMVIPKFMIKLGKDRIKNR